MADIKVKRPHRAFCLLFCELTFTNRLGNFLASFCLSGFPRHTPVDHAQLYAQALHLLDGGMRYWLDEEETMRLEEHNAPYKTEHGPEELLTQHFTPVEKKHYDDDEL